MNKRELGNEMEMTALHYLESCGYEILEHNFYMRGGEIDIVALEGDELAIIEVKYRKNMLYGTAAEAVTKTKMKKLINTAMFFVRKHPEYEGLNMRFDVLAIDGKNIELIKSAFDAC
ncbi:MAG: YraN family protein [Lachnospiraceae bacterium]|nr:YraN family protein [Lachnospiraceae bacterium]